MLAPTWLSIVLPAYALLAHRVIAPAGATAASAVRRAPVWVTGSGAELAAVQYRPSAYSNPMRVILRGPLGYRTRLRRRDSDGDGAAALTLDTRVVLAVDRFLYAPADQARAADRRTAFAPSNPAACRPTCCTC